MWLLGVAALVVAGILVPVGVLIRDCRRAGCDIGLWMALGCLSIGALWFGYLLVRMADRLGWR